MSTSSPSQEIANDNYWTDLEPARSIRVGNTVLGVLDTKPIEVCHRIGELYDQMLDGLVEEPVSDGSTINFDYDHPSVLKLVRDDQSPKPGRFSTQKTVKVDVFDSLAQDIVTHPLYSQKRIATQVEKADGQTVLVARSVMYARPTRKQKMFIAVPGDEVNNDEPNFERLAPEMRIGQAYEDGKRLFKIAYASLLRPTTKGRQRHTIIQRLR